MKRCLLVMLMGMALSAEASEQELTTDLVDQTAVAVTIYNQNLALVKDQRRVKLDKGINQLAFRGVSANIRPETALLRSLKSENKVQVLEQNFDFDLLSPQKLLEKYTGRQVQIARTNPVTGKQERETATVLSTYNGVTLRVDDKIIVNPDVEYIFEDVPSNLRDQPTLGTTLTSNTNQTQIIELGYLTGGLSWHADYVAELSRDERYLDLTAWVTLNNQSGTPYNQAKIQLVAGDVNQVKTKVGSPKRAGMMDKRYEAVADVAEESLFEYHLYTLGRLTTLADKQIKQVSLLSAASVPVKKTFLLQGQSYYYNGRHALIGEKMKVATFIGFDNKQAAHLGLPLPKGVVRVYKNDRKGNAQFVGEDNIDHTPKNEAIRLKLGDAFDITANKKQVDFEVKKYFKGESYHSHYEVKINNAKSEEVTVVVREPIPGQWEISKESHPHKKVASNLVEWQVTIPAESRKTLSYMTKVLYK